MGKKLAQACQTSGKVRGSGFLLKIEREKQVPPRPTEQTLAPAGAFKETLIPVGIRNSNSGTPKSCLDQAHSALHELV